MLADNAIVSIRNLRKGFGDFRAVNDLSLEVRKGEIFALLGASGCGKSTTLRMIAGLEQPDSGEISLGGNPMFSGEKNLSVAPQRRNIGMVFQSYAIWPHLTVFDTVGYALVTRKIDKAEIKRRVEAILKLVGLDGYENRFSSTLSGGQQQRVALARALVYEPELLLLDEPFSNLDVHLREQMRIEVRLLQRRVGVTVILVTHDQAEALSLSDRVGVMNGGRLEQIGNPIDLYENPCSSYVRDFIGTNFKLSARFIGNGKPAFRLEDGTVLMARPSEGACLKPGDRALLCIRPERMIVAPGGEQTAENAITAFVETALFVGDRQECVLRVGSELVRTVLSRVPGREYREGDALCLILPESLVRAWPM